MQTKIDWIRHHKTVYVKQLPNGFSVYISVNTHKSGKITVALNCSVIIGTFPTALKRDLGKISDTLHDMSEMMRTQNRV